MAGAAAQSADGVGLYRPLAGIAQTQEPDWHRGCRNGVAVWNSLRLHSLSEMEFPVWRQQIDDIGLADSGWSSISTDQNLERTSGRPESVIHALSQAPTMARRLFTLLCPFLIPGLTCDTCFLSPQLWLLICDEPIEINEFRDSVDVFLNCEAHRKLLLFGNVELQSVSDIS